MNAQEFITEVNELSINHAEKIVRKNQEIRRYGKALKQNMGAYFGNGSYSTFSQFKDKRECGPVPEKFLRGLERLEAKVEEVLFEA